MPSQSLPASTTWPLQVPAPIPRSVSLPNLPVRGTPPDSSPCHCCLSLSKVRQRFVLPISSSIFISAIFSKGRGSALGHFLPVSGGHWQGCLNFVPQPPTPISGKILGSTPGRSRLSDTSPYTCRITSCVTACQPVTTNLSLNLFSHTQPNLSTVGYSETYPAAYETPQLAT